MSENNHDCECGHDHEEETLYVTLETEDGEEIECEVIAVFDVKEKQYAAVAPDEEYDDKDEGELFFFRLEQDDEDEDKATLIDIEDDKELELVVEAFQELLDDQEWEELTEED